MKAVILAGGMGTRLGEEGLLKPKPMVEIWGMPILWHILKIYAAYGIQDFLIACGHKGEVIRNFFGSINEPWKVECVDTGAQTQTGGRLKRLVPYLGNEDFCMTYGDGLADIPIDMLIEFHRSRARLATVTAVPPPVRFGALALEGDRVTGFLEKAAPEAGMINGGYFVLSPKALENIAGDETMWEGTPLERLSSLGQLSAYRHSGFWLPMDTPRDRDRLESLWRQGQAPWKVW